MKSLSLFVGTAIVAAVASGHAWAQSVSNGPIELPIDSSESCYFWAEVAEQYYQMPPGLMRAIISHESKGRPYTLNVDGDSHYFATAHDAAKAILEFAKTSYEIDVGCGQVNSRWHGGFFRTVGAMLDPRTNLSYAAWHLSQLRERFGSWSKAAARYHSYNPERSQRYACQVWKIMAAQAGEPKGEVNPCIMQSAASRTD